jgi:hypothetical protein
MTRFLGPLDGTFVLLEGPGSVMNVGAVIDRSQRPRWAPFGRFSLDVTVLGFEQHREFDPGKGRTNGGPRSPARSPARRSGRADHRDGFLNAVGKADPVGYH